MRVFLLALTAFFTSCASTYHSVNPSFLRYNNEHQRVGDGVRFTYRYDVLGDQKKYAKKEKKNSVRLIAVKIQNNSPEELVFGTDLRLTYGNRANVHMIEPGVLHKQLKQNTPLYLLYLLLTPLQFNVTNTNEQGVTETSSTPVGLVVGPGVALGNMIVAGSANKRLRKDLLQYDLVGRTIKSGETVYGLVGIRSNTYEALKLRKVN
ncbi:MAG: hypothetical protein MI784_04300 [Cytophagales bacterium]|nr:hypothetical protein [Cytophagales bacterium]